MMAACGLVLSAVWVSGRQAGEKGQPLLGYIKDNSLFVLEENGESREISDICLRDWKNREQLRLPEAVDWIPFYYEEAGALWYPEQVGDGAFFPDERFRRERAEGRQQRSFCSDCRRDGCL